MKLLPSSTTRVHSNRDALGQGMDAVFTLVLFFTIGFFTDRWLGTTPLFMIVLVIVASVGVFLKLKYAYDARMAHHEADRAAGPVPRRPPTQGTTS